VPSPYTKDDAYAWIALADAFSREGRAWHLVIEAGPDETAAMPTALLGSVGVEARSRPAPHAEIGYWVAAPVRGHGVATRAVQLLAGWAFEALALPLEIHVLPANAPSHAVARKAGFEPHARRRLPFRGRSEEFVVYRREPAAHDSGEVGRR
jgi:RimJ/RimL family protein N-acetyltransferase